MEIKRFKKYSLFKKEEIRPASIGAALLFSFCQYLLIETGIRNPFAGFEPVHILYICAGVFDLLYLNLILTLLTGRKSAAFAVTTVAALVLSLVNHYTWLLHGEPFTFDDLKNAGTAMGVLESYRLELTPQVLLIILGAIVLFFAGFPVFRLRRSSRKLTAKCMLVLLPLVWLFLMTGKVIPKSGFGWSWKNAVNTYGYLPSMLRESRNRLIPYHKPAGYDRNETVGYVESYDSPAMHGENRPDVILILNETFYDFDRIADIDTDGQVFTRIPELDNCIRGYTVVPGPGGGTNKSEYELLTSNSLHQITSGTPFNMLDLEGACSVVTYMKNRGYQTTAFHPYLASGYKRYKVYPLLGFDTFHSSEDGLLYDDKIRTFISDSSDFKDLEHIFEQNDDGKTPQFIFNVTMQNHGNYNADTPAVDVTVKPTDGKLASLAQLEEYLALAHATDQAFEELLTYFAQVKEPTIILMFGDHQPGLNEETLRTICPEMYEDGAALSVLEKKYTVPYIMWANFDLTSEELQFTSPNFLRSYLLENDGIEGSAYDRFTAAVRREYPAINILGYSDAAGELHSVSELGQEPLLSDYRKVAYYNLFDHGKVKKSLFE